MGGVIVWLRDTIVGGAVKTKSVDGGVAAAANKGEGIPAVGRPFENKTSVVDCGARKRLLLLSKQVLAREKRREMGEGQEKSGLGLRLI